jgi:hypothetical protein
LPKSPNLAAAARTSQRFCILERSPKAPATICQPFTVGPICSDLSVDFDVAGAHAGLDGVADLLREDVGEERGVAGDADLRETCEGVRVGGVRLDLAEQPVEVAHELDRRRPLPVVDRDVREAERRPIASMLAMTNNRPATWARSRNALPSAIVSAP